MVGLALAYELPIVGEDACDDGSTALMWTFSALRQIR